MGSSRRALRRSASGRSLGYGAAMSVLNKKELAESPLADLHQIASELGVEGYRAMRREDLVGAILGASGAAGDAEDEGSEDTPEGASEDTSEGTSEDTSEGTSEDEPDEVPADEALDRSSRRRGGRRRRAPASEEEPEVVEDELSDGEIATGVLDVLANGS